ncbi:hypothetical protein BDR07DRAFT_1289649 [Suillus spraguei]|nr:hypothetical protein BDR07DRAFT_1289649 [Suillus spraguei]
MNIKPQCYQVECCLRRFSNPAKYIPSQGQEFGGGFMVGMETPHQLHCLNLLCKSSWADCYEPADIPFQDMSEDFRMHLGSDQVEYMCNADVTLLTWDWVQGHNIPYPNFNTRHQCRNYKKLSTGLSNTLCISLDRRLLVSKIQLTCTFPYI